QAANWVSSAPPRATQSRRGGVCMGVLLAGWMAGSRPRRSAQGCRCDPGRAGRDKPGPTPCRPLGGAVYLRPFVSLRITAMQSLPIDAVLPALRAALSGRDEVVLEAPPGAGKTTRVPLALLEEPWLAGQSILMLEPRRLAARAAVERLASER